MTEKLVPRLAVGWSSKGHLSIFPVATSAPATVTAATKRVVPAVPVPVAVPLVPVTPLAATAATPAAALAALASVLPASVLPAAAPEAALVQQPLVVLHQLAHLVGQLQSQGLHAAWLSPGMTTRLLTPESNAKQKILLPLTCALRCTDWADPRRPSTPH